VPCAASLRANFSMQHRDVAIHTNVGIFGHEGLLREFPPITSRVDLSDEIWIGILDPEMANTVMNTCEPKVYGMVPPARQYAQLYSFVRELPTPTAMHLWDTDNRLAAAIAISRLIHPTYVGFAYAARVAYQQNIAEQVFPAQIRGISADVMLSANRTRDWLTQADAEVLRELVPLLPMPLPTRVHNAFWHHEYAARTYYLDHRWTLIVTGLEALLNTNKAHNKRQFERRVPQLASELAVSVSEVEAGEAYDLRSKLAHGVSFISTGTSQGPSASQVNLYDRLEDTLRFAVLRSMRERAFGDVFRDDDNIRQRWRS
jgi:hypothetical protein